MSTGVFLADNVAGFNFLTLSAPPIPADKACHYGQSSPTRESSYHLADDWYEFEAIQVIEHAQEDLHTDNSPYNSRNRVLEGIIYTEIPPD